MESDWKAKWLAVEFCVWFCDTRDRNELRPKGRAEKARRHIKTLLLSGSDCRIVDVMASSISVGPYVQSWNWRKALGSSHDHHKFLLYVSMISC